MLFPIFNSAHVVLFKYVCVCFFFVFWENRCRDRFPDNGNLLSMICPIGMSLDAKREKCCNVYYEECN